MLLNLPILCRTTALPFFEKEPMTRHALLRHVSGAFYYQQGVQSEIEDKEANDSDELMVDDDVWFGLPFCYRGKQSNASRSPLLCCL